MMKHFRHQLRSGAEGCRKLSVKIRLVVLTAAGTEKFVTAHGIAALDGLSYMFITEMQ